MEMLYYTLKFFIPAELLSLPFMGPECIAFDESGDVYVSLNDGTVAVFTSSGVYLNRIFFTGGFIRRNGNESVTIKITEYNLL